MSTELLENFDKKVIERAKEYADTRNLNMLGAIVDTFEETQDKKYKLELFEILKEALDNLDAFDKDLAKWRASRKSNKSRLQ